ncbi:MAG: hypothetical protein JWN43_107 [Gammaproteobacteria bacterium]|nr:hypothetical protein [Gammaproteobacteria bacterium]
MKVRYLKRRARRPDFRILRYGETKLIEVKGYAAVTRFFGPTKEDDERAAQFFDIARANP